MSPAGSVHAGFVAEAIAAAILFEATEDGAHEAASVLAVATLPGREPHAQGERQALDVFDPSFVKTVRVEFHSRAVL
jgi:hypothetical protein